jgi:hypothetical protein
MVMFTGFIEDEVVVVTFERGILADLPGIVGEFRGYMEANDIDVTALSVSELRRLLRADVVAGVRERQLAGLVDVEEFVEEFVVRFALSPEAVEPFEGLLADAYLWHTGRVRRPDR